ISSIATATATPTRPAASPSATGTPSTPPEASATVSATATVCALRFSDVPYNDPTIYYAVPVYYLACHGVVSGYSDGTFRPYNQTTRQQMVKIVALGFALPIQTPPAAGTTFTDVPMASVFFAFVETAAARGIVSGYACGGTNPATGAPEPCDGPRRPYFRPASNVTRAQLAKITVLAAGWATVSPPTATFNDVAVDSTFYPYIETAVCHSILSGYSCGSAPGEPCPGLYYRPSNNATRGQISKIVYNALNSGPTCGTR
ncbi:MAG: S-layer homology domain-containing protein, partial [Chloroflexota bacterium]|nr:S-layer homology domain-containing protein [Chloroflexota bacterium]